MGIKGLLRYCLEHKDQCVEQFDLIDIARRREEIELLVDFYSFEHLLLQKFWTALSTARSNPYLRLLGGEYTSLNLYISKFVDDLKSLGIKFVFFIDGSKGSSRKDTKRKLDTWVSRHHQDVKKLNELLDVCRGMRDMRDLHDSTSVRPVLLETQVRHTLRQHGCEIVQCAEGEADYRIAKAFKEREKAFCVLSNDSDFCIFKDCLFVPNELFDIHNDLQLGAPQTVPEKPTRLMVGAISMNKVMTMLNFQNHRLLVELSIIVGNDFTGAYMYGLKSQLDIRGGKSIPNMAEWVNRYKTVENHQMIGREMSYDQKFCKAIQHSRDFYNLTLDDEEERDSRGFITQLIVDGIESGKYPATFMGMHRKFYWHRMLLEDTSHGHPCIEGILSHLRGFIYRILLPRHETLVTEYGRSPWEPFGSVGAIVVDDRHTPGIQYIQENKIFQNLRTFHHIMSHVDQGMEKTWFDRYGRKNGFIFYVLRYFLIMNWGRHLNISENEFLALFALAFARPGKEEGFYQEMAIRPTPRCITVGNWFQDIYRHAYCFLGALLNLTHEFPTPDEIFSGSAWAAFYTCSKDEAWDYGIQCCHVPIERLQRTHQLMNRVVREKRHMIRYLVEGMFEFDDRY